MWYMTTPSMETFYTAVKKCHFWGCIYSRSVHSITSQWTLLTTIAYMCRKSKCTIVSEDSTTDHFCGAVSVNGWIFSLCSSVLVSDAGYHQYITGTIMSCVMHLQERDYILYFFYFFWCDYCVNHPRFKHNGIAGSLCVLFSCQPFCT